MPHVRQEDMSESVKPYESHTATADGLERTGAGDTRLAKNTDPALSAVLRVLAKMVKASQPHISMLLSRENGL